MKLGVIPPADERTLPSNVAVRGVVAIRVVVVVVHVLATSSCGGDAKRASGTDTARIVMPAMPEVPTSRFSVPLQYDFTAVLAVVDRVVPHRFGSMDSVHQVGDDTRKHYAFEATREPFSARADGPLLHLRAGLSYRVRGYYKPIVGPTISAGCGSGDEQPRMVVEIVTPLTMSANWHLASKVQLARVEAASTADSDHCKVSVLRHDVTDQVLGAARAALTGQLPEIDRRIAGVDLTSRFNEWWHLLSRPIQVSDGVWLVLAPERLRLGKISGAGRVLTIQAGLDARPRIVTGAQPPPLDSVPLPALTRDTVSRGFFITLEGVVDYATASRAVTSALHGRVVAEGGRTVVVDSVVVSPAPGGRLALAVNFTGDARGTLRFLGTPHYDALLGEVTIPDLDYDLTTNSQLINTYAWLRSDMLRTRFREKAHVPETPVLDRAKSLLLAGLNRKIGSAMTLTASVDSVAVRGLYVTPLALVARAEARGKAVVSVKQQ